MPGLELNNFRNASADISMHVTSPLAFAETARTPPSKIACSPNDAPGFRIAICLF